jgi:hypothetical protein
MIKLEKAIQLCVLYIEGKPHLAKKFEQELKIIKETKYARKLPGELPFPFATTTWGRRYVRLSWKWNFMTIREQAGVLCHEAVHSEQCDTYRVDGWKWWRFYLKHHEDLERSAHERHHLFLLLASE